MTKSVLKWVHRLNDPHLVARTQAHFGIRLLGVAEEGQAYVEPEGGDDKRGLSPLKARNVKSARLLENEQCFYAIENKLVYWFFLFITHMGNEVFYITFLPTLVWFYAEKTMLLTCLSWALIMYLGQATKDIIK
jgi:hypothetical protein